MAAERRVVVVGGGIGGLTAALLLAESGARVTVLERVARPGDVGAGILLQPNGLAVLAGLGLVDRLAGHRVEASTIRDGRGRVLTHLEVPDCGPGLDHALALPRSGLHRVLLDAVAAASERIDLRLGTAVTSADADGWVHVVESTGRSRISADLIVGADGVGSVVRSSGDFGTCREVPGPTYLRGLVDGESDLAGEYWTALGIFGGAPLGDGTTYFYASADDPTVAASLRARDLASLRQQWQRVLPASTATLERVQDASRLIVTRVVRVDCDRWTDGRLVLVGDAAHAMAPTQGQGGNSALVDAAVLAHELTVADRSWSASLAAYERRRRAAVRRVQDLSDRLARLSGVTSPIARRLRDLALRAIDGLPASTVRASRSALQEDPARLLSQVRDQRGERRPR